MTIKQTCACGATLEVSSNNEGAVAMAQGRFNTQHHGHNLITNNVKKGN